MDRWKRGEHEEMADFRERPEQRKQEKMEDLRQQWNALVFECQMCNKRENPLNLIFCLKCKIICGPCCGQSGGNGKPQSVTSKWPGDCGACCLCVALPGRAVSVSPWKAVPPEKAVSV